MSTDLIRRAQGGDREAFAELSRLYAPLVTGAVLSRVHRFQEAEDLVQETFLRALEQIGRLRDPERIGAWLYGIAVNVVREARRTVPAPLPAPPPEPAPDPVDPAVVRSCLEGLPLALRELFVLRHIQGLSYRELGSLRGATTSSVGERLWKARQLIRRCLASKGALPEGQPG